MPLLRWETNVDPFASFQWLRREFDRAFDPLRLFGDARRIGGGVFPNINIYNGNSDIVVLAEVPGVRQEDMDVSITGDTLTIKGRKTSGIDNEEKIRFERRERGSGEFTRVVILPDRVAGNNMSAKLKDGILTVTLPKSEAAKPKQITVQS
jgi:HSP20 family protein